MCLGGTVYVFILCRHIIKDSPNGYFVHIDSIWGLMFLIIYMCIVLTDFDWNLTNEEILLYMILLKFEKCIA